MNHAVEPSTTDLSVSTIDVENDEASFVPRSFQVPEELEIPEWGVRLEPLGPQHNERDYQAWSTSIDHILRTPGFRDYGWPVPMSPDENRQDLVKHAEDYALRRGFTYSVLISDEVIGCVYIYPGCAAGQAVVRSWVAERHAELDQPLHKAVDAWLHMDWPFTSHDYVERDEENARLGG